ncbi:MAG: hypothetical protein KF795_31345, partial [Labilithrix sp.]|nr:hypothetical protein [Labilithrix sp.]
APAVDASSFRASAVKSLDFAGGRTSGSRLLGARVASGAFGVRWLGGATGAAPLATGAGIARGVGPAVRDGRLIGGFFFSPASFGDAMAARDAAIDALLGGGRGKASPGTLRGAASSGRTAGMRVVESMRVDGTSSPSSASE